MIRWVIALLVGLYLAILPFAVYAFARHNNDCPCHSPERLIKKRLGYAD